MRALLFEGVGTPLRLADLPLPEPGLGEVRVAVGACGICRTDLHVVDGELDRPKRPVVLGHQVVGRIDAVGPGVEGVEGVDAARIGERVGIPWLGSTCGTCARCTGGRENLCDEARFTGYDLDGGLAEACVADARFVFPIPEGVDDVHAAPWLCAGLIGYRALRLVGDGQRVGLYGFGAAAHLAAQVLVHQGREVFAFTRPGDEAGQRFARELGAVWAGGSDETPPVELDGAVIFAPVGALVPAALRAVGPGGRVVCGGIHMSAIPSFPYELLWRERALLSVANLTREDAREFLALAPTIPVRATAHPYPLERAAEALEDLRAGRFEGAAVVVP
jgi:propanol-preferring alcohol dehydrogenase